MTADIRIDTLTIRVPLTLRRYGGRKLVIVPEGGGVPVRTKPTPDDTLLKALARAHRWKRMLESGQVASLNELSEAEKISPSYLTRIYRLTLLAPDIVEAILDGRPAPHPTIGRPDGRHAGGVGPPAGDNGHPRKGIARASPAIGELLPQRHT